MPDPITIGLILALLIDTVVRGLLVVRIVMRRRSVPVSLAWLVVLLFAPGVGAALYLLVGETRLGHRRAARHARAVEQLKPYELQIWRDKWSQWPSGDGSDRALSRLATAATGLPPVAGNRLEMLADAAFVERLVTDIEAAERHVHICTYIWMSTGAGETLAEALIAARARGIDCRVLVDGVGSRPFLGSALARRMRAAGVEITAALPASLLRLPFARLDLRNHRKLAVVDGRIAFVGSHNVTDDGFRVARRPSIGPWVDATIRIEGPAAQAAQLVFVQDWLLDCAGPITVDHDLLPDVPAVDAPGTVVQLVPSGPGAVPAAIHDMILATIWSAREELILTTPYFVPDEGTRAALRAAALRGINVTLVVPERLDGVIVGLAGNAQLDELLAAGVRVMRHQRGLLHSKTLTVDRRVAIVGSVNMDMRSFWLNFELTLLVPDDDVASHVAWLQQTYMDESKAIDPAAWARRPLWRRFVENVARLLGPLL
ncbi:MAG: cardiolipin synthase [Phycisphaerales bacterium]